MKDQLGRNIVVGDTLAFIDSDYSLATGGPGGRAVIKTAKVSADASFALQLVTVTGVKGKEEPKTFVVSKTDDYIIVEFASQ